MPVEWPRGLTYAVTLAMVFTVALTVRVLYRTDRAARFDEIMPYQTFIGHRRAVKILNGEGVLVWDDTNPRLLRQIRRPPGFPAYLAAIYTVTGPDLRRAQLFQDVLDALAATLVAAIGIWLIAYRAGLAAGLLCALSPHLAAFANIVTPDAPAAWPVLVGVALFIGALRRADRWAWLLAAAGGLLVGASCWLTAQGLTLPVALAVVGVIVAPTGARWRSAALGLLMTIVVVAAVAPLTIRNVSIYGALVPIRPGLGTTLLEGLGVYDASLPATDGELLRDEAARYGRPEYEHALYSPDGLERERDRTQRALDVIASRPVWFGRVMLDRMGLMMTYEYEGDLPWPDNTAYVASVERGNGNAVQRALRRTIILVHWLVFRSWLLWLLMAVSFLWFGAFASAGGTAVWFMATAPEACVAGRRDRGIRLASTRSPTEWSANSRRRGCAADTCAGQGTAAATVSRAPPGHSTGWHDRTAIGVRLALLGGFVTRLVRCVGRVQPRQRRSRLDLVHDPGLEALLFDGRVDHVACQRRRDHAH